MIAIGFFMFLIAVVGSVGIKRSKRNFTMAYTLFLLIIVGGQFAIGYFFYKQVC